MVKKILFWTIIIFVSLLILLFILLPGIVKRYTIENSKELIGRQIELDDLKLNYFTGTIILADFIMFEEDEKKVFVSFDTLIVNLEPYQFFKSEFVMESLYLKGLDFRVIQYDTVFNFDDLIAFHTSIEDTTKVDREDEEPFRFQLSNIEIHDAGFVFDDRNVGKITSLRDLSFFIPFVGWNQEDRSEAGLRFSFKNEGYFESLINVDPIDGAFEADITIHNLYLNTFKEYVQSYAHINGIDGVFNSNIKIYGNIYEADKLLISGTAEVNDFIMEDGQDKKFLGAKKLECVLNIVDVHKSSYIFDSLIINEPYVNFEMDSLSNNFFKIFDIGDEDDTIDHEEYTLYYALNHTSIEKGIVDYSDNLTGQVFEYHLSEIEMKADSILSTSKWVNTYSKMLLNNRGTVVAEVGYNPENPMDIVLDYIVTDFQLSDLNIYSRHYMGFPILYGDMYYKSHTEIINNQLNSENKLVINNAELGDKNKGIYSLPIKFALFLLKDRNGVIDLDIPVRGNLDDPSVSVGKIVWNTFKNLIVKVAAAPFDFLAGFIKADPKDIKEIKYAYLDTTFTAERQRQLDLLLNLEHKKEGLEIELVYFNDREIEKKQIVVNEAGKLFASETGKDVVEDKDSFIQFLQSKSQTDSIDIFIASKAIIPESTVDSVLRQFENSRMNSIKKYLSSGSDSTNINIFVPDVNSPKNVGVEPIFEVKYTMKEESLGNDN